MKEEHGILVTVQSEFLSTHGSNSRLHCDSVGGMSIVMNRVTIPVVIDTNILAVRMQGREMARRAGFKGADLILVSAVISEMARCIKSSTPDGELIITIGNEPGKAGVVLTARYCRDKVFQNLLERRELQQSMDEFTFRSDAEELSLTLKRWQNVWA